MPSDVGKDFLTLFGARRGRYPRPEERGEFVARPTRYCHPPSLERLILMVFKEPDCRPSAFLVPVLHELVMAVLAERSNRGVKIHGGSVECHFGEPARNWLVTPMT